MKAQSQSLHSETAQVVESTFGFSSSPHSHMKFRQSRGVTIHGTLRKKIAVKPPLQIRAERSFEAFFIAVFLLCLFLTGCSGSMTGQPESQSSPKQILTSTGEANLPAVPDSLDRKTPPAASPSTVASGTSAAGDRVIKSLVGQDAVVERVRTVSGWLAFVSQEKSAALVGAGWQRLKEGKVIQPLNNSPVPSRSDISTTELMLWRQLLKAPANDSNAVPDLEVEKRLEMLAVTLTLAATPDDVLHADDLLVVPENVARY